MRSVRLAPFTVFLELNFPLNFFLVLGGVVVMAFTGLTLKLKKVVL